MMYKMLFGITLIIPFGLLASDTNNRSLFEDRSKKTVVAWLGSVSTATQDKSVGTNVEAQESKSFGTSTENDSEGNPVLAWVDRIVLMQEKTASLYTAQNQMMEKLAENQKKFYRELQALQQENKDLKRRISELEKQKK